MTANHNKVHNMFICPCTPHTLYFPYRSLWIFNKFVILQVRQDNNLSAVLCDSQSEAPHSQLSPAHRDIRFLGRSTACQTSWKWNGKFTVMKIMLSWEITNQKLHTVNCHLHTETSDFVGGPRPVRHHENEKVTFLSWKSWQKVQR